MTGAARRRTAALPGLLAAALLASTLSPLEAVPIDPLRDGIALGISAVYAGSSELLLRFAPSLPTTMETSLAGLSPMDSGFMFRYSRQADVVSTFLEAAAMLTPIAFSLASDSSQVLSSIAVYGESVGLADGTKNYLKHLLPRYRPYAYQGGAPGVDPSEDNESYPSGHSTMSFMAAAFTTYLYVEGLPGSAPLLPFVVVNYALAGLTASYRVLSGMHYPSDVLAGAAIGMICGFMLPAMLRP